MAYNWAMLKKIVCVLLLVLVCGCATSTKYEITELNSFKVDMSAYKKMNSINHQFSGITCEELLRLIDEKGSAVVYMGFPGCPNCREATKLVNQAAIESGITVYYINVDDKSNLYSQYVEQLEEELYSILPEIDDEKNLRFPFLFAVKDGVPSENYCGLISEYDGSETTDQKMITIYKNIMKDFVKEAH